MLLYKKTRTNKKRGTHTYKTLEVIGPEHEYSLVDHELKVLPIVDKVLKDFHGRIVNFVKMSKFSFGKELQLHVMELKPNEPFTSPVEFENTIQEAVLTLHEFIHHKYGAYLLGTGMHPLLKLGETGIWPHRHRQIYEAYSQIFSLKRHGWLNIQSYQLNLPYSNEKDGVLLHDLIMNILPYLPAITASSPICEGKFGEYMDNRLHFYKENQREIPSITADIVPEPAQSFVTYDREVVGKYSKALAAAGANKLLLDKEWVNSRGVIFRFDRRALEIRVMDEQECVKSDVALSCFIRALLRGLTKEVTSLLQHKILVRDFNSVVKNGLSAKVENPRGKRAREVCRSFLKIALDHSTQEERSFLPIVQKRIENGNLSEILREQIKTKSQKTDFHEAVVSTYLKLTESLIDNHPHF